IYSSDLQVSHESPGLQLCPSPSYLERLCPCVTSLAHRAGKPTHMLTFPFCAQKYVRV
ncbi:hypothetical protein WMY93_032869, partial [Mugilogobius chulae]